MKLGVCYYPEHWPQDWWAQDAQRMRAAGISLVRIAEFAWSRIEPDPGRFEWAWLDKAIETLHQAGLGVVMCTPTATPPKWLVDAHPDILAVDALGNPRGFGSRRHYCFSSSTYREQARRISEIVTKRYGEHPAVQAWQTDNEYGCHDTILSYSQDARKAFRRWLQARYKTVDALNRAWGTVFWSQEYRNFDEVDPPVGTVTEANPSHRLDYRRFASDEVVAFNRDQVALIKRYSPGRPVSHNFMGFFTEFNHHDVAQDLDIATWDSYPLGFTQMFVCSNEEKQRWARTGHPDIPGFHHDLYRGMCKDATGRGRWWVMEQQPGPVNWAHWNPAPMDGMVRVWTWQAFGHGAEVVSYFRWRQAPFAQEQMHTGLLRPDSTENQGYAEAAQVGSELAKLGQQLPLENLSVKARVALVFDYDAIWMTQIQPQGLDYNALELTFRCYSALRQLGLDVDIVSPKAALAGYRLIVLPAQNHVQPALLAQLQSSGAQVVFGPRFGSKTQDLHIPSAEQDQALVDLTGVRVLRVSSLPPGYVERVTHSKGGSARITRWREDFELHGARALASFSDGRAALAQHGRVRRVAGWLSDADWLALMRDTAKDAGLEVLDAPAQVYEHLRVHRIGNLVIVCNFGEQALRDLPRWGSECLLGQSDELAAFGVAVWRV
jgi:beta-galactosidase